MSRRICFGFVCVNLFAVPGEGTGVCRLKIACVYRALVGTFTRAIRRVSEACIVSPVVHSLYVQVSREIGTLEGFVRASKVGACMHSVETGQCRVAGDILGRCTYNSSLFVAWSLMCLARSALRPIVLLHILQSTAV